MNSLNDFTIVSAFFNLLSTAGNLFWSWKISGVKSANELSDYWKLQNDMKESQMEDMREDIRKLHKRLGVYQRYHNHKPLA